MSNDNENLRPFAEQAYNEVFSIEQFIKEPNNQKIKGYLENLNNNRYIFQNDYNTYMYNQNNFLPNFHPNMYPNFHPNMYPDFHPNIYNQNNYFHNNIDPFNKNCGFENNYIKYRQNIPNNMIPSFGLIPHKKISDDANKSKNTSFIRIFQCLYSVINNDLYNIISLINNISQDKKDSLISLDIFNVLKMIGTNFPNKNNNINFEIIQNLRNKLSLQIKRFQGNEEIEPNLVIKELFKQLNKEFLNCIPYENQIFNGLMEPANLPK